MDDPEKLRLALDEVERLEAKVARLARERSTLLDLLDASGVDRAEVVRRLATGED